MSIFHTGLTPQRWQKFNLFEQLGNVGSEVHRILLWKGRDEEIARDSFYRALELMDLTISDSRWRGARLREILRAREVLADAFAGGNEYGSTLEDMDKYFFDFALAARLNK